MTAPASPCSIITAKSDSSTTPSRSPSGGWEIMICSGEPELKTGDEDSLLPATGCAQTCVRIHTEAGCGTMISIGNTAHRCVRLGTPDLRRARGSHCWCEPTKRRERNHICEVRRGHLRVSPSQWRKEA